ncbi:MAG: DUF2384 domain-containing protein [Chitinophagaceae bacterium]|nr:DUF2384 domain-containing protein [Chitinophagaceae bacterium]
MAAFNGRRLPATALAIAVDSSIKNKESIHKMIWLILGGKEFIPQQPNSSIDYIYLSSKGVPKLSIINLAEILNITMKDIAQLLSVSSKTLGRLERKDLLDPLESSLSIELASLTARGISVFGDSSRFNTWLKKENRALSGKQPFELLNTPTGLKLVGQILERIEEGVYT